MSEVKTKPYFADAFKLVFSWIDGLRGSSYYVDFDLNNLEHIFSLADMSRQINLDYGKDLVRDLRYVIMETLDRCQLKFEKNTVQPDDLYITLLRFLNHLTE